MEHLDIDTSKFEPKKPLDEQEIVEIIRNYMKNQAFTDPKVTDTPRSGYHVVNRKYVTLNGASTNRPTSSVLGQFYLDTSLNLPLWWNGTGWQDATGAYH